MKPTDRKSNGFTLIELLVVIGIIALLIAILLPVLNKARKAADRVACMSNIRQLGIGVMMYCQNNNGWFPTCAMADDGLSYQWYPDDWLHWEANRILLESSIAKYVGGGNDVEKFKNLLRCPADNSEGRKTRPASLPGQGPYLYSYYMNGYLGQNQRGSVSGYRTKITQWRSPWRKIVLTEADPRYLLQPAWGFASPLAQRHGIGVFHGNVPGTPPMSRGSPMGIRVSTAFMDGHVEGIDQDFSYDLAQVYPELP